MNSAWAENVGTDNTTPFNTAFSTPKNIETSQMLHYEFVNYSSKEQTWCNWLLYFTGVGANEFVLRADGYWWSGSYNSGNTEGYGNYHSFVSNIDETNFKNDMDGALVSIDFYNMGYWVVIKTSATNNGRTYSEVLKLKNGANNGDGSPIQAKLSAEHSHLVITKADVTQLSFIHTDFTTLSVLDNNNYESGGGSGWTFDAKPGYYNGGNGYRTFTIKNLRNGDHVSVTFTKHDDSNASVGLDYDAIKFSTTNAKMPTGDAVTTSTVLVSDNQYYITADGNLVLNVHRNVEITDVDIFRSDVTSSVSFSEESLSTQVGASFTEPTLTVTPSTATAYYSSDNTSVAVVDEKTGEVTLVGAGNVNITATLTVNSTTETVSYSLTVTSATTSTTEYYFTGSAGNINGMFSAGTTTINNTTVNILDFTSSSAISTYPRTESHPDNRFGVDNGNAIDGSGNKWYLRNAGLYAYWNGNRDFYVLNLFNGDKVTIDYEVYDLDSTHPCGSSSLSSTNATLTSGVWQTNSSGSVEYTMTESGALKLSIGKYTYIKKVTIQHESDPSFTWSDANLATKFVTINDGKHLSYKITDMNFTEPLAVKVPASATHTVNSLDKNVAIMNPEILGDVLFVNTGSVNIQGTMQTNDDIFRKTYTVDVWADLAEYTDANNRYEVTGIGKLQEKEVTSVRGLKMNFGSDDDCTLVLYDDTYNAFVAYTINKNNGWRHRNAGDQSTIPTHGSFYKFQALTSGKLRFSGVKNGDDNTVVLMDERNMSTPVYTIADSEKGIKGTGTGYVQLTAGHTYYLFGNVPDEQHLSDHTWAAYMLTWFSFDSDFKLVNTINGVETEVNYGAAPRTNNNNITSVNNVVTIKGMNDPTITVVGCSGDISTAKPSYTVSDDNSILNVENISGSGGAIRFKIEKEGVGSDYFTLTIPYATHAWDFRTGDAEGENGQTRISLANEIKTNGTSSTLALPGITRIYRSVNKTGNTWVHLGDPLLVANGKVEGNNGFYIGKTAGLIFVTPYGANFGALETKCTWTENIYNTEGQLTGSTTHTETAYNANRGLVNVPDETEYYFGPEVTDEAEYVYMKSGTKIIFPGVRPGQFIKLYTIRLSNLGDHWTAENLVDLENKEYTSSNEIIYLGINEDRPSGDNTPYAWRGDNLKGSAMFKVPDNYDATNTDISKMPSLTVNNGWVKLMKIELLDEYKTDLYLSETNANGFFKVDHDSEFASVVVYKKNGTAIKPVRKFYEGTVGKIGATHAHTCDYEVVKDPMTLDVSVKDSITGNGPYYNDIILTFNGGSGLVKIIQREYGDDTGASERADQHIINKKETYIAVSEVNVQTYPYTWDFTNHNMYQRGSTTTTNLGNNIGTDDYGTWERGTGDNTFKLNLGASVNTAIRELNRDGQPYAQVGKPLFAQGGSLTAGASTIVGEADGLGISRPYGADRNMYSWATGANEAGKFGMRTTTFKTYDLTAKPTINGSNLSGVGTITLPQVDNGMYIFVKASAGPTSYDGLTSIWDGWNDVNVKDPFGIKGGVWLYQNRGTKSDFKLTFGSSVNIELIAVTNEVKTINELGYASESRAHAIDHTYQNTLTNRPVQAYAITTYEGEPYNYKGYPTVKKSENALTVVPANTGVVLYDANTRITDGFSSPLISPAVNNMTPTDADNTILATNYMAPNVESTVHETETELRNGVGCTKFGMTRTYYTYSTTYGDSEAKTSAEAFYRLRIMNDAAKDRIEANKAYLLIPTAKLPVALWNGGSGEGVAGQVRQGMIYLDLEELENVEATGIVRPTTENFAEVEDQYVYYSVSGTRIIGTPKTKGIYIREDGKKVCIK